MTVDLITETATKRIKVDSVYRVGTPDKGMSHVGQSRDGIRLHHTTQTVHNLKFMNCLSLVFSI